MKNLIVRECAVKACQAIGCDGGELLLAILDEAFGGDKPDFSDDRWIVNSAECRVVYEAIAPDIIASVRDEPTKEDIADDVCSAICGVIGDIICGDDTELTLMAENPIE